MSRTHSSVLAVSLAHALVSSIAFAAPEPAAVPAQADAKAEAKPAVAPAPLAKPEAAPVAKPAAPEPADDVARFLAGLPVPDGSPLKPLEESRAWKSYSKNLSADWAKLRAERLDKMAEWSKTVLRPKIDATRPVFYLFGGPDFMSVAELYPDAPAYLLCGLEPLGKMPRLSSLTRESLDESIDNLHKSINSIVRLSFFKTNDMSGDLTRTELRGILPILYLFVARSGATLLSETRVEIDETGTLKELGEKDKCTGIPGVRLRIQRPGHAGTQDVFYFKHNVEDDVITAGPGFFSFFKKHAPANTFLKAASFLLHRPKQFGKTHDFLVENSTSILQDDSGLPFASLAKGQFSLTLYGTYLRPRPPFTMRLQDDMTQAFKDGPVETLPFLTGYRHVGEANLVLAIPKPGGGKVGAPEKPEATPAKAGGETPAPKK